MKCAYSLQSLWENSSGKINTTRKLFRNQSRKQRELTAYSQHAVRARAAGFGTRGRGRQSSRLRVLPALVLLLPHGVLGSAVAISPVGQREAVPCFETTFSSTKCHWACAHFSVSLRTQGAPSCCPCCRLLLVLRHLPTAAQSTSPSSSVSPGRARLTSAAPRSPHHRGHSVLSVPP